MKSLPRKIVAKAYVPQRAKELAWRRPDVPEALRAIVASGQAVLGGEVWVVQNTKDNWQGLVPDRNGGPPGVWHWETTAKGDSESWQRYCERTAEESLTAVSNMKVEENASPEVAEHIWFNISYIEPNEV